MPSIRLSFALLSLAMLALYLIPWKIGSPASSLFVFLCVAWCFLLIVLLGQECESADPRSESASEVPPSPGISSGIPPRQPTRISPPTASVKWSRSADVIAEEDPADPSADSGGTSSRLNPPASAGPPPLVLCATASQLAVAVPGTVMEGCQRTWVTWLPLSFIVFGGSMIANAYGVPYAGEVAFVALVIFLGNLVVFTFRHPFGGWWLMGDLINGLSSR